MFVTGQLNLETFLVSGILNVGMKNLIREATESNKNNKSLCQNI